MPFTYRYESDSKDCIKNRGFLTKLWTKISWVFFIYAPCSWQQHADGLKAQVNWPGLRAGLALSLHSSLLKYVLYECCQEYKADFIM